MKPHSNLQDHLKNALLRVWSIYQNLGKQCFRSEADVVCHIFVELSKEFRNTPYIVHAEWEAPKIQTAKGAYDLVVRHKDEEEPSLYIEVKDWSLGKTATLADIESDVKKLRRAKNLNAEIAQVIGVNFERLHPTYKIYEYRETYQKRETSLPHLFKGLKPVCYVLKRGEPEFEGIGKPYGLWAIKEGKFEKLS